MLPLWLMLVCSLAFAADKEKEKDTYVPFWKKKYEWEQLDRDEPELPDLTCETVIRCKDRIVRTGPKTHKLIRKDCRREPLYDAATYKVLCKKH